MKSTISPTLLHTVDKRHQVLQLLQEESADKRELVEKMDISQTMISRGLSSLEDLNCITYEDGKWETTLVGELAYTEYEKISSRYKTLESAGEILNYLPSNRQLDVDLLTGAELYQASKPTPHEPIRRLEQFLSRYDELKAVLPVIYPMQLDIFKSHIEDNDGNVQLVLEKNCFNSLSSKIANRVKTIANRSHASIYESKIQIDYDLIIIDKSAIWIGIYDSDGGLRAALINTNEKALKTGRTIYETINSEASPVDTSRNTSIACQTSDSD